jgi:hypothetical protein
MPFAPKCLGDPGHARHWPIARSHHFQTPLQQQLGSVFTAERHRLPEHNVPRVIRQATSEQPPQSGSPARRLRLSVRAIRPSTVPWAQIPMDAEKSKAKSVGDRRSMRLHKCTPLSAISQTLFENRSFGIHSPSRDHDGDGDARTRVTTSRQGAGLEPARPKTLARFKRSGTLCSVSTARSAVKSVSDRLHGAESRNASGGSYGQGSREGGWPGGGGATGIQCRRITPSYRGAACGRWPTRTG